MTSAGIVVWLQNSSLIQSIPNSTCSLFFIGDLVLFPCFNSHSTSFWHCWLPSPLQSSGSGVQWDCSLEPAWRKLGGEQPSSLQSGASLHRHGAPGSIQPWPTCSVPTAPFNYHPFPVGKLSLTHVLSPLYILPVLPDIDEKITKKHANTMTYLPTPGTITR